MNELVVLVNEKDEQVGTADKVSIHTIQTPLHRGFSVFVFNPQGQLLLTKRSKNKKTFAGVWTNTVCGHPGPGEEAREVVLRRLEDELRIKKQDVRDLHKVSDYRYRFTDSNGIVENEICPVFVAYTDVDPQPVAGEVDEWKWADWQEVLVEMQKNPEKYSPWSREEAELIDKYLRKS